MGVEKRKKR